MSEQIRQESDRDAATQAKIQQVQDRFGAAAANYVTSAVHASGQDLAWIIELSALTGTEHVLDVGTGTGHTAFALAPFAATVVALDITQEMLSAAQHVATERQLPNIQFVIGNALSLPFEDARFDLVTCRLAAHHFPQVKPAIQEWARVLKPSGKLILVDTISPEEADGDLFVNEIEILRDPSHIRNYRRSEWTVFVTAAGFTVTQTHEQGILLDIPSWTQRIHTPPASVAIIEERLQTASPVIRELLHIARQGDISTITLPALLLVATKHIPASLA